MGVNALPGTRTLTGSHPYRLGTVRVVADEFFRPGFASGLFASGELVPRVFYGAILGNSLSQLGITANKLSRSLSFGGSIWWMPTTGDFGPCAFGDYEWHNQFNDSWEYLGGANWYPAGTRNLRFNPHVIRVNHSPVSSVFGYYTGGQSGTTVSFGTSVFF